MNQWKTHPYLLLLSFDGVKVLRAMLKGCNSLCRALRAGKSKLKKLLRSRDGSGEYARVGVAGGENVAVQMTDMEGVATDGSAGHDAPQQWDEEAQALVHTLQVRSSSQR